jgi:hypothetical protein
MEKDGVKLLSFPAPARYTNSALVVDALTAEALPDLSQYVLWVYDRVTFPYRSLHDGSFMRDYKIENGRIAEGSPDEPVLNQEFVDQVLRALDKAPGNAIEKVLKKQGGFRAVLWANSESEP